MYHLVEVEVAALYPRIRKVSPNCRYQGCFKITDNGIWINPWVVSGLTGVRDPTVSGGVRSAGPLLANSHLLKLEPNFFSFLQSYYILYYFFTAHLFPRQNLSYNLCSKCLVLCMQQLTLSCCERENVTTSSAAFAAQSIHNIVEWKEHIWLAHSLQTVLYLAWYLVQEDEHQSAAAVFLSNFCSPGGFADKWPALAFSCCIVTLSQLIRTVDTTFSFVVKYNNFWLLSLSSGNDASVVMHAAQQYNVLILFWHVFYQGVAHEPVVHGDVSSSSDYCRAKPFDDCCGRGVHLMRPFILLAYVNLHFGNFLTKVSNTIRIAASLSCRFRSERVAWSSKRKQRSRKRSRWRDIVEEKISTPVPSVLYKSHRLRRLL
ncbi:hypothetical protein Tsp_04713 [Trichinella spiralis]|uniref:hypothetical protein n=1 Tax=Trichinella spiralis TaxID=6334 RepID=UPI0001EFD9E8|nr:hypothetical protein Tsp_04713 [Trichinella spiralis]